MLEELKKKRDELLRHKVADDQMDYFNGVLDMYNAVLKLMDLAQEEVNS